MEYIAHSNQFGEIQKVSTHCKNVAELSKNFAIDGLKDICYNIGLLHDAGKYLSDFQKRINGDRSISVEHSIVGAKIAAEKSLSGFVLLLTQLCVAGHHSGIPDCGTKADTSDNSTLYGRLTREVEDYGEFFKEISLPKIDCEAFNDFCLDKCKTPEDVIEKFAFFFVLNGCRQP